MCIVELCIAEAGFDMACAGEYSLALFKGSCAEGWNFSNAALFLSVLTLLECFVVCPPVAPMRPWWVEGPSMLPKLGTSYELLGLCMITR